MNHPMITFSRHSWSQVCSGDWVVTFYELAPWTHVHKTTFDGFTHMVPSQRMCWRNVENFELNYLHPMRNSGNQSIISRNANKAMVRNVHITITKWCQAKNLCCHTSRGGKQYKIILTPNWCWKLYHKSWAKHISTRKFADVTSVCAFIRNGLVCRYFAIQMNKKRNRGEKRSKREKKKNINVMELFIIPFRCIQSAELRFVVDLLWLAFISIIRMRIYFHIYILFFVSYRDFISLFFCFVAPARLYSIQFWELILEIKASEQNVLYPVFQGNFDLFHPHIRMG